MQRFSRKKSGNWVGTSNVKALGRAMEIAVILVIAIFLMPIPLGIVSAGNQGALNNDTVDSDTLTAGDQTDFWDPWGSTNGYYTAVAIDCDVDYNLRTQATGGGADLAISNSASGTDICVVRDSVATNYRAEVYAGGGGWDNTFYIEADSRQTVLTVGSTYSINHPVSNLIDTYDIDLVANTPYSIGITSATGSMYYIYVFSQNFGEWRVYSAGQNPGTGYVAGGMVAAGGSPISFTPTSTSRYGVVVYSSTENLAMYTLLPCRVLQTTVPYTDTLTGAGSNIYYSYNFGGGGSTHSFTTYGPTATSFILYMYSTGLGLSLTAISYPPPGSTDPYPWTIDTWQTNWRYFRMFSLSGNGNGETYMDLPDIQFGVTPIAFNPAVVSVQGYNVMIQNRPYLYTISIRNQGYSATGAFNTSVYIDSNLVQDWGVANLAAWGGSATQTYMYPSNNTDRQIISSMVDYLGSNYYLTVRESRENNNVATYTLAVAEEIHDGENDSNAMPTVNATVDFYYYTFYYLTGQTQRFWAGYAPNGTDFWMRLYNPSGTQVASATASAYPYPLAIITYAATVDGWHYIRTDRITGTQFNYTFGADSIKPTIQILSPSPDEYVSGNKKLIVSCADVGSGVVDTSNNPLYRVDAGLWIDMVPGASPGVYTATVDTTLLTEGSHTITFAAQDYAFNSMSSPIDVIVDNTAPNTPIICAPTMNEYIAGTYAFKVDATDNQAVRNVSLKLPGMNSVPMLYNSQSGYWEYTLDTTTASDGTYSVQVWAYDYANKSAIGSLQPFYIDNHASTLAIVSPSNNAILSGTVEINATSTDTGFTPKVEYRVDNGAWVTMTGGPPTWTALWDTSKAPDGSHIVYVRSTDPAGHVTALSVAVVTDNTNPQCTVVTPTTDQYVEGAFVFQVQAIDTVSISSVTLKIGTSTYTAAYNAQTGLYEYLLDTTIAADGALTVNATALDSAGHSCTSATIAFSIDNHVQPWRLLHLETML